MRKWKSRLLAVIVIGGMAAVSTGCSTFGGILGAAPGAANAAATPAPTPTPSTSLAFDSVFTDFGSVHPVVPIGDNLELQLDMWTEQKTHEWYTTANKKFSFVISVFDRAVPADAPFAQKRPVYMSNVTVTATTSTTGGSSATPFVLNLDPVTTTLDPEALRSDAGLLITSPKGGFQLESNTIGVLTDDTYGLVLDFSMTITVDAIGGVGGSAAGTRSVVHQPIRVAIFRPPAPTTIEGKVQ